MHFRQEMLKLVDIAIIKAQSIDEYERENALRFLQHATYKNVHVKDMIRCSGNLMLVASIFLFFLISSLLFYHQTLQVI